MAIIATETNGKVTLVFNTGVDEDGNLVTKSKVFNRVKPDIDSEKLYQVSGALASLQQHPINVVRRTQEFELIEE